jgi:hypothetical protein
MISACGGSKQTSSMRQIEKSSKKNPVYVDKDGNHIPVSDDKKVRQAIEQQQKKQEAEKQESQKTYREAVNQHREMQTPEVRNRMDQQAKQTDKKYSNKKEFFLVRWFRPKDDVEKIEKRRAKEMEKRMAATRKQAKRNNQQIGVSSDQTAKSRKVKKPDPKDVQQGGGGVYKEASATKYVNPKNIQQGGGGSYTEGNSKKKVKPSDVQQGGGGSYQEKTKKKK